MPALLTSRSSATAGGSRTFSRVTSFKREWDDEEPVASGSQVDWSPSPERTRRKLSVAPPISISNSEETPAERRRKAMMAAMMSENQPPPLRTTAPLTNHLKSTSAPNARLPPLQELPSIPIPSTDLLSKKRQLPWEEDINAAKKAMARTGSAGTKRSNSSSSSTSTINIKQKVVLSAEQQKVLTLVVQEGKNIFFTGSAGTGKSVLLREIISSLRKKYVTSPDAVAVTASTGIAACNIGGVTLHSFGGAGLANEKADVLVQKVKKNKKAVARWTRTKVLIIDEVSMVDGDLFDKFCKIGQMLRKKEAPFGGIQIIVTGDFFQLPPVTKGNSTPKFCFDATMWDETIHMSVNLSKVFRQKDQKFVDMLNEMRFGRLSQASIQAFKMLDRKIVYDDGIEPTVLFPRREDVDRANAEKLKAIKRDGWTYTSTDGGAVTDPIQRAKLLANFMAPDSIVLKENAQVMLIKNLDETLVNGSMGKVIGFEHKALYVTDAGNSRWLREGEEDVDGDEDALKRKQMKDALRAKFAAQAGNKPFPVVQFKIPGGHVRDLLVEPDTFKSELPNGEVQASRSQLPLILAWAMSIHKSQGQTLDRVQVDLGKVFEKGQAYVALSRATTLEGLEVKGFSADKVMAHRRVAQWSQQLRDLN